MTWDLKDGLFSFGGSTLGLVAGLALVVSCGSSGSSPGSTAGKSGSGGKAGSGVGANGEAGEGGTSTGGKGGSGGTGAKAGSNGSGGSQSAGGTTSGGAGEGGDAGDDGRSAGGTGGGAGSGANGGGGSAGESGAAGQGGEGGVSFGRTWSATGDFRLAPNNENPSRDTFENPNVWHYLERPLADLHDPSTETYLSTFIQVNETDRWQSPLRSGFHLVGHTQVGSTLFLTAHNDVLTLIAWESPIEGTVTLTGSVRSGDTTCGNGTSWFVDRESTPLATGTVASSQEAAVPLPEDELAGIAVNEGTRLYFIIHANGEHSCDTLIADLVIREHL
jgi:hypothetical protein